MRLMAWARWSCRSWSESTLARTRYLRASTVPLEGTVLTGRVVLRVAIPEVRLAATERQAGIVQRSTAHMAPRNAISPWAASSGGQFPLVSSTNAKLMKPSSRLVSQVQEARRAIGSFRVVLLAQDCRYTEEGDPDWENSSVY